MQGGLYLVVEGCQEKQRKRWLCCVGATYFSLPSRKKPQRDKKLGVEENSSEVKRRREMLSQESPFPWRGRLTSPQMLKTEAASSPAGGWDLRAELSCAVALGMLWASVRASQGRGESACPGVSGELGGSEQNILYVKPGST